MKSKRIHSPNFIQKLISTIERYQYEHLLSNNELSEQLGLSSGLIGKIKSRNTNPSYQTLRKIKKGGIKIPDIPHRNQRIKHFEPQGPP